MCSLFFRDMINILILSHLNFDLFLLFSVDHCSYFVL